MMNGASLAGQLLRVVQSLLVMKMIGPESFGFWLGLQLVVTYAAFCHLGVEGGLGFRLAYYRGSGDTESSRTLSDTGYLYWTLAGLLTALAIAVYALLAHQPGTMIWWGLLAVAVLVLVNQQTLYLTQWHIASLLDFFTPSGLGLLQSVLSTLFVLPLVYYFRLPGLILGTVLAAVVALAVWRRQTPYTYSGSLSRPLLLDAMKVGFPNMVISLVAALMQNVDRLLILTLLGSANLGYYGITALGGSFVYGLLAQAGNAINPHIAVELGKGGESAASLRSYLIIPTRVFAALSAALLTMLAFAVPPLVEHWLPRYVPGIPAFLFFLPGFFFLSITLTAGNILNGVLILREKQRYLIYIQLLAVAVGIVLSLTFVGQGLGLVGVALSSTLSYAVYGLTTLGFATAYVLPRWADRARFFAETLAPLVVASAVAVALFYLGGAVIPGNSLFRAGAQIIAAAGLSAVALWASRDRLGIRDTLPVIRAAVRRRLGRAG